jgi:hypothetical protein
MPHVYETDDSPIQIIFLDAKDKLAKIIL